MAGTILKGLAVLKFVAEEAPREGATLSEVAQGTQLHMSTASRYLATLRAAGFVEKDPESGRHRLGVQALRLGALALSGSELREVASPHLNDLVRLTKEAAHLAILDGTDITYIDKMDSPQAVRMWSAVGSRLPAYCSAAGKAILAYMPEPDVTRALPEALKRHTQNTIVSRKKLFLELDRIRHQGYAVDDRENRPDIRCVGAPVFGRTNEVVGALSVSAPANRLPLSLCVSYGRGVKAAADAASHSLGSQKIPRSA